MLHRYLYQALPFLKDLDRDRQEQFENYFETAPLWLMESFRVERMPKGTVFVRENAPVDTIYLIGQGSIKAVEYRVYGVAYNFMRFDKVYAMGGMEVIMDLNRYMTTLVTVTDCIVVKIPKVEFERWILSDIKALKMESKLIGQYLLEQGRNSRAYLFLQGSDRLAMLFAEKYERYARKGKLCVLETRQELSDETGLCVKTINRSVKKFTQDGLITKVGNRIYISKSQYEGLRDLVDEKIDCR